MHFLSLKTKNETPTFTNQVEEDDPNDPKACETWKMGNR